MARETTFSVSLEPELSTAFLAEVEATQKPVARVMRELINEFVQRQQDEREYDEYLNQKVAKARLSKNAGRGRTNQEVELTFAKRRESVIA
jgi:hypothetical protein